MRTRKTIAVLGVGLILACCVMIYLMMDLIFFSPSDQGSKLFMNDVSFDYITLHLIELRFSMYY